MGLMRLPVLPADLFHWQFLKIRERVIIVIITEEREVITGIDYLAR